MLKRTARTDWSPASIELMESAVRLDNHGQIHEAPLVRRDGFRDFDEAFAEVARSAAEAGTFIRACGGCRHFRFSGLSHQMSDGRKGYCRRLGFRDPEAEVDVDHHCPQFDPLDEWPTDMESVKRSRLREDDGNR